MASSSLAKLTVPCSTKDGVMVPETGKEKINQDIKQAEMYSIKWWKLKSQKNIESSNMVKLLNNRELGEMRRTRLYKQNRDMYTCLPLHQTTTIKEMFDRDHIISWTPDGSRLICFSFNRDSLRVYRYRGAQNARYIRDNKNLEQLFEKEFEVNSPCGYVLRADGVSFTASGRFLIVGTTFCISETSMEVSSMYQNNESIPIPTSGLEDLCFMCIDLEKGQLVSEKEYFMDKILLSGGVNISGNYLMVTSIQHQIMFIIHIHPQTGQFVVIKEIGPSVQDDDTLYLPTNSRTHLMTSLYTGFRQKIMSFLYKKAKEASLKKEKEERNRDRVMEFLRKTNYYESLRIDRTHLFNEFFILIRMLPKDLIGDRTTKPIFCFFVVLDWRDGSILDIFEEFDERFYNWTEKMAESLLYPQTSSAWSGTSNFISYAKWKMTKSRHITEDKYSPGSMRCLLNQLPFHSYQPYKVSTQSPYLDPFLFHLDTKTTSGILNGSIRINGEDPRFTTLRTKLLSYQLPISTISPMRYATIFYHPQDPLALCIDRYRNDSAVHIFQLADMKYEEA